MKLETVSRTPDAANWPARCDSVLAAVWELVPPSYSDGLEFAYWISGGDEGHNYCRACARAEVERINAEFPDSTSLDGGYGTEHDSTPHCETCGKKLSGSLTNYGVSEALKHFAYDTRISVKSLRKYFGTAHDLAEALGAVSWASKRQDLTAAKKVVHKLERLFARPAA